MAGPTTGMRLGRGMTIFLAVDAILVTAFLVMLALALAGGGVGSGSSSAASASSSAAAAAGPGEPAPGAVPSSSSSSGSSAPQALDSFALPSGNIACTMSDAGAKCTIASITFAPPTDAACTGTIGHVFEVGTDGVRIPCVDGPAPGVAAAGTPQLEYGRSSTVGGYTCTSSTNGVRCVEDATGRGFELARSKYSELP